MKIMIVDDHREMRRLVRCTLSHMVDEFVECENGSEAVAAFARERPDWTIMDIAMKPMDGLEATGRIKARFADARIVILTQHDSPPMREAAFAAGACGFLAKENLDQVTALLALRPQNRPGAGERGQ
jgi:CheY-like chemotaxis protein